MVLTLPDLECVAGRIAATDVHYRFQWSGNLQTWTDFAAIQAGLQTSGDMTIGPPENGRRLIRAELPALPEPLPSRTFLRVIAQLHEVSTRDLREGEFSRC